LGQGSGFQSGEAARSEACRLRMSARDLARIGHLTIGSVST
jgi:hypothetical protein